jgi:hypothetical protein
MTTPNRVPVLLQDILERYAEGEGGALTGGARPLVENNLADAIARADGPTMAALGAVVQYLHDEMPEDAWGSPEKVRAWTWRRELAAHPDAERVVRIERDQHHRLGPDTHTVNRYALRYDEEGGQRYEVAMFVECLGIFPSELAAVAYVQAMTKTSSKP